MTLILHHDEVQQYFDMRDDIMYYKNKVSELEDEIAMLRHAESFESFTTTESDSKSHTTDFSRHKGITPTNAGRTWTEAEYGTIKYLFNRNGKYNNKPFDSVAKELFPNRSKAGVYNKLRSLGFSVRNKNIVFPIKLDYTKFPS